MNNQSNIDEVLKQGFENFAPQPPAGVWEAVSANLGNTAGVATGASKLAKLATTFKQASIITKFALVMLPAAFGTYVVYTISTQKPTVKQEQMPQVIEQTSPQVKTQTIENQLLETSQQKVVLAENAKATNSVKDKPAKLVSTPQIARTEESPTAKLPEAQVKQPEKQHQPDRTHEPAAQKPEKQANAVNKAEAKEPIRWVEPDVLEPSEPIKPSTESRSIVVTNNAFSPNGDGINDEWEIRIENETYYHMQIFDNKNNLMFESNSKDSKWRGENMRTGNPCPNGMYFYEFNYRISAQKDVQKKQGVITLIK